MIQELQKIFRSIIKCLDVLYVIEDAKPCSRILVKEEDLDKAIAFLNENKLFFSVSGFKLLKQSLQSDFYSDSSVKASKEDIRKGNFVIYISKDKNLAEKAKIAEENNNHPELGAILGYPECCCRFFDEHFSEKNTDLTFETIENSAGYEFSFYNNICARHFDVNLLSHFPHSFDCRPSVEIAKNNLKILHRHSKQLADLFANILRSVVVYTGNEGIFLIRKWEKISGTISYGDVLSTSKTKLYFLISSNRTMQIVDRNSFIVGNEKVEGNDLGVMVFD